MAPSAKRRLASLWPASLSAIRLRLSTKAAGSAAAPQRQPTASSRTRQHNPAVAAAPVEEAAGGRSLLEASGESQFHSEVMFHAQLAAEDVHAPQGHVHAPAGVDAQHPHGQAGSVHAVGP